MTLDTRQQNELMEKVDRLTDLIAEKDAEVGRLKALDDGNHREQQILCERLEVVRAQRDSLTEENAKLREVVNQWLELGSEMKLAASHISEELRGDLFPDWFLPRLEAALAAVDQAKGATHAE